MLTDTEQGAKGATCDCKQTIGDTQYRGGWTTWKCAKSVDVLKFLDFRNGHDVSTKLNCCQGETLHMIFSGLKKYLDNTGNEMSPACGLVRAVAQY